MRAPGGCRTRIAHALVYQRGEVRLFVQRRVCVQCHDGDATLLRPPPQRRCEVLLSLQERTGRGYLQGRCFGTGKGEGL